MITITQGPRTAGVRALRSGLGPEGAWVASAAATLYERLRKRAQRAQAKSPTYNSYWTGYQSGARDALQELVEEL